MLEWVTTGRGTVGAGLASAVSPAWAARAALGLAMLTALGCGSAERDQATADVGTQGSGSGGGSATSGVASGGTSSTGVIMVVGDTTGNPNECRRVVSLEGVTLGTPPPFDVVIVADNSESLSWSREDLAHGLSELMANVYGHAVRFFVLTPTQYDENSAQAIDLRTGEALVNWKDPVSGVPYTHGVTRYTQSCKDAWGNELVCPGYPAPALDFELEGRWEFALPEPAAALDSEMTVEQLTAERAKVVDAILALGVLGSPEEQPVCTLSRYLHQPARQLPERAVFLVISDEDDTASTEQACLGSYEFRQFSSVRGSLVEGCTQNCDSYRFSVARRAAQNSFAFDCAPVDDLGNVGARDTWRAGSFQRTVDTCDSTSTQPCSDEEQQWAQAECDGGYFVQTCTRTCVNDATDETCSYSSTDDSHDLCNESFGGGDNVYANLVDYCERAYQVTDWGPCTRVGFSVENVGSVLSQASVTSPVVRAKSVDDMIYLFHADAERSFGEQNYFVESILFTEGSSCVPQAGQSYGTGLAKLASSPEQVYPICESYAPALSSVNSFAQDLLETEYTLELGERESIESVVVESRDGSTRDLGPDDYQYDKEQARLSIDRDALRSSDLRLSVEVLDPCAPPIK
jgi:hypothetical protein